MAGQVGARLCLTQKRNCGSLSLLTARYADRCTFEEMGKEHRVSFPGCRAVVCTGAGGQGRYRWPSARPHYRGGLVQQAQLVRQAAHKTPVGRPWTLTLGICTRRLEILPKIHHIVGYIRWPVQATRRFPGSPVRATSACRLARLPRSRAMRGPSLHAHRTQPIAPWPAALPPPRTPRGRLPSNNSPAPHSLTRSATGRAPHLAA